MGIGVGMRGEAKMEEHNLELRLLGEFQIISGGQEISLPASRKTRALGAYLVATGVAHRREWLCDLLWEGPDDPRGELRWSLAKIRPLLDAGGVRRLHADRARLAFEQRHAVVDLVAVRELLADVQHASVDILKAGIGLFRGEFLDGLDLPACYRFQEWCLAERAAFSTLRLAALRALIDRLSDYPEEALVHARMLAAADPLSEEAHSRIIELLGRQGRRREAMAQYEQARSVLVRQLGVPLSGALERARRMIGRAPAQTNVEASSIVSDSEAASRRWAGRDIPLVGRNAERAQIDALVSAAANGRTTPILVITGEPGIGKSRLLDHLAERMAMIGGRHLRGRAFEAEAAHPYGVWIDVLRALQPDLIPNGARQHLALLRPDLSATPLAPTERAQLFDAVLSLLRHLSRKAPVAVVLDDVQWLDEASATLLHYLARQPNAPDGVLLACAARSGELADNLSVARMLRALGRDARHRELPLAALSKADTAELVRRLDPEIDAISVFEQSDGNPLFALELAQGHSQDCHQAGRSLQAVIAGQLAALDEPCRNLLAWASAIGRSFDPGLLARLVDGSSAMLLAALERLERRGILRALDVDSYDFVHDLIRRAAYQDISQPRRKLIHSQIAGVLNAAVLDSDGVAAELVRHAELAGDHTLAARACIIAGERSLRLFENADAMALARRGRSHLDRLPDGRTRRELKIAMLRMQILAAAGPGMRPLPPILDELSGAVADAEEAGLNAAAATGHYLLSVLHQETGDIAHAQRSTVRAVEIGRETDRQTFARQLANTARCLIELEAEIPRARALLAEAESLLGSRGRAVCELQWGRGLLARWSGDLDEAITRVECALDLARAAEDRWREYKCLTWLAILDFEHGRHASARRRCHELRAVAGRLGESEAPVADAIEALSEFAEMSHQGPKRLVAALSRLRGVDDKGHLAYVLNTAAMHCLARQQPEDAKAHAQEALDAARTMERENDVLMAEAMLAVTDCATENAERRLEHLRRQIADSDRSSARARIFVERAMASGAAHRAELRPASARNGKRRPRS